MPIKIETIFLKISPEYLSSRCWNPKRTIVLYEIWETVLADIIHYNCYQVLYFSSQSIFNKKKIQVVPSLLKFSLILKARFFHQTLMTFYITCAPFLVYIRELKLKHHNLCYTEHHLDISSWLLLYETLSWKFYKNKLPQKLSKYHSMIFQTRSSLPLEV